MSKRISKNEQACSALSLMESDLALDKDSIGYALFLNQREAVIRANSSELIRKLNYGKRIHTSYKRGFYAITAFFSLGILAGAAFGLPQLDVLSGAFIGFSLQNAYRYADMEIRFNDAIKMVEFIEHEQNKVAA